MKANEAPEKIYLIRNISTPTSLNTTNDCREKYLQEWYKEREKDTDIEYIRKDAFVEKAVEWISNNCYIPHSTLEEFRAYMKGEKRDEDKRSTRKIVS